MQTDCKYLPHNVSECIKVQKEVQVELLAQICHEFNKFWHILNRNDENSELRAGDVVEKCCDIGVSDDSVEEQVYFAL